MDAHGSGEIRVRKWRTERPLLALNGVVSAGFWAFALQSYQSATYVGMVLVFAALVNVAFIAYIRGSAVRLGPAQFPELSEHVRSLAQRMGLRRTPSVYLMQQDGTLNAFAMRFLRSHIVVLLSDLLEACGDNAAARDMVIGHELGHIRAGHLYGRWLLAPASFVPFLGSALARAREYTCDRYGFAAAGDRDGALVGLSILAAGPKYGPLVNRETWVRQREDLRGLWMLVGEWLGSHPPLSKRVVALAPELHVEAIAPAQGALRWVRPAAAFAVVIIVGAVAVDAYLPQFGFRATGTAPLTARPGPDARAQVDRDLARLRTLIEADVSQGRLLPWDLDELYGRWKEVHPKEIGPIDPFSGYWYDYDWHGTDYRIWSLGPDAKNRTSDDIVLDSRMAGSR
jgi:Zn-dependent protease with chaperone function